MSHYNPRLLDLHATPSDASSSNSDSHSPPSSSYSPRSSTNDPQPPPSTVLDFFDDSALPAARPSCEDQDRESGCTSSTSDSYDSAGEGNGNPPTSRSHYSHFSGDEGSYSSRVSSRGGSPPLPQDDQWAYRTEPLAYRSVSRNRSRNGSGTTTPTLGFDKETYGADYNHSHHYQTSALLRKLNGTLAPNTSPVLQQKRKNAGWWKSRAERRKRASSDAEPGTLLPPSTSKSGRHRSCLATFGAALLRQPWVPTQPLTILFSLFLLGCFAATVTTFLVHVLSTDKQPLDWRKFCQEQRPFPHALADSLAPVDVFVGVFSVDAAFERRQLIRTTYVAHTKPIDPVTGRPAHNVQVKFILGRPEKRYARRIAYEMELYNDIVVLDLQENMNRGKTHAYFTWAQQNATVPINYRRKGSDEVGVGFKRADYVVKADHDSFIRLDELERNLRVTPREKTYWGYLVRQLFMAGEAYALSADLVDYVATYEPILAYTTGAEDKRVAKWMRIHPNYSSINWIAERCWIYDHPKSGTTYARGFTHPDEVERIRLEGRRGIPEEERLRRGGDLSESYSTVTKWKTEYSSPAAGLSVEEEVEALVEGGGRWAEQGWRADGGKGVEAVRWDAVVFQANDERLIQPGSVSRAPDSSSIGVIPGLPDKSIKPPSARTTKFGKDLFRDPADVAVVQKRSEDVEDDEEDFGVYNAVAPPPRDASDFLTSVSLLSASSSSKATITNSSSSLALNSSSSKDVQEPSSVRNSSLPSTLSTKTSAASTPTEEESPPVNTPTGQIRLPAHNYILPPSTADRFLPPPSLRYDPTTLTLQQQRSLNRPHGGTIVVHFLKRNEWFMETALHFIGRSKIWDEGVPAPAFAPPHAVSQALEDDARGVQVSRVPTWQGTGEVELVTSYWGGARQYGSPIVREDGYVAAGRAPLPHREVVSNTPTTRLGRLKGTPRLGFRLEDGEEATIGEPGAQQLDTSDSPAALVVQAEP
ncbi:hypothetical protein P7C70_g2931, partial [Phenoliferia sp. Uapishka_3]